MRIDAHQHFWRYEASEYAWIDEDLKAIRRDFLPGDLAPLLEASGIDATIAVQARQSLAETEWLLGLAGSHPFIAGVVGWLPLERVDIGDLIARFASDRRLVGLRHVLQGEADPRFALRPDFDRGLATLEAAGLSYDILIREDQLPEAIAMVDRHPNLRFVLDHAAKPRVREGLLSPWEGRMRELARRDNVWCKLSGLVTEAEYRSWTEEDISPFLDVALEAFGARRLLFGSDWPVCTVACAYALWVDIVGRLIGKLSLAEGEAIRGGNALRAYALEGGGVAT